MLIYYALHIFNNIAAQEYRKITPITIFNNNLIYIDIVIR